MPTISQRATRRLTPADLPIDPLDRDHLREQWRLAAVAQAEADEHALVLKESRSILLDELTLAFVAGGKPTSTAEKLARTDTRYRDHITAMAAARKRARLLEIEMDNKDRLYWQHVSREATERTDRRMSR